MLPLDRSTSRKTGDMRLTKNPVFYTAQHQRWIADKISKWPRFWKRCGFSQVPDLSGKRILDLGSGLGGNSVAAAMAGADVVALEPDTSILKISSQLIIHKYPDAIGKIKFIGADAAAYRSDSDFDYVICDEVFEHMDDLPAALEQMAQLLGENGKILSHWGPLWKSPFGGHQLTMYLIFKLSRFGLPGIGTKSRAGDRKRFKIPYTHLLYTKRALREVSSVNDSSAQQTIQQVGLNGLKRSEFIDILSASSLHTNYFVENPGTHPYYRVMRAMHKIPPLRGIFTSNIAAVLSKDPA